MSECGIESEVHVEEPHEEEMDRPRQTKTDRGQDQDVLTGAPRAPAAPDGPEGPVSP